MLNPNVFVNIVQLEGKKYGLTYYRFPAEQSLKFC